MSNMKCRCPICGCEIEVDVYSENIGVCERYCSCKVCGYASEYAYGNYQESVNGNLFVWNYRDNEFVSEKMDENDENGISEMKEKRDRWESFWEERNRQMKINRWKWKWLGKNYWGIPPKWVYVCRSDGKMSEGKRWERFRGSEM